MSKSKQKQRRNEQIKRQESCVTIIRARYREHLWKGPDSPMDHAWFVKRDQLREHLRQEAAALKGMSPNEGALWQENGDDPWT